MVRSAKRQVVFGVDYAPEMCDCRKAGKNQNGPPQKLISMKECLHAIVSCVNA